MVKSTSMINPTPTIDTKLPRRLADFATLVDALEYAASGIRGINFYSARGDLEVSLTYKEARDRAVEIGRRLTGLGLKKGARIALIADTSDDFVCFFLGAQYASVLPVPLPLPTSFGGREGYVQQLALQLKSCSASVVITPESMEELVEEAVQGFDLKFSGTPAAFLSVTKETGELCLPKPEDIAYLQYSSGSTRFPHGISVTHKSLMANCHGNSFHGVNVRDDDRVVSWLPFYHDMGLVGTFLTALASQVSLDYLATEDFARRPMTWLKLISRNKATITYSPTFGYDLCARRVGAEALAELDLSHWRIAGIGGDMIRPEVMRNFADTFGPTGFTPGTFMPSYGLAECTLAVSFMPVGRGVETDLVDEAKLSGLEYARTQGKGNGKDNGKGNGKLNGALNGHVHAARVNGNGSTRLREIVNCGKPLPEYEIEIRDPDSEALEDHSIGRVFVRGTSVMHGYFNDPEATAQVLCQDGWLDTGDMGYLLDGCLFIVGRVKDLIIVNGKNHWPQDLEWAAEQLPGVRNGDIAAIAVPGDNEEEIAAVLVQCRLRDPEERRCFAEGVKKKILEATGVNCKIELIAPRTLPRTSSGKLSRAKARTQFLSGGLTALAQ